MSPQDRPPGVTKPDGAGGCFPRGEKISHGGGPAVLRIRAETSLHRGEGCKDTRAHGRRHPHAQAFRQLRQYTSRFSVAFRIKLWRPSRGRGVCARDAHARHRAGIRGRECPEPARLARKRATVFFRRGCQSQFTPLPVFAGSVGKAPPPLHIRVTCWAAARGGWFHLRWTVQRHTIQAITGPNVNNAFALALPAVQGHAGRRRFRVQPHELSRPAYRAGDEHAGRRGFAYHNRISHHENRSFRIGPPVRAHSRGFALVFP